MSSKNNTNEQASNGSNKGWESISTSSITSSFGGMHGFMGSYGLKPTPDGYDEAREIINAFKQADYEEQQNSNRK